MSAGEVRIPGPRAHRAGTLALLARFAALAGRPAALAPLAPLFGRAHDLPAEVPVERRTLKYDAYLAPNPAGLAWGVAVADRHEEATFPARVAAFVAGLAAPYDLAGAEVLRARLPRAAPALCLAVGFDRPDAPPRLKLYLQEERWGEGLATRAELDAALGPLGLALPDWLAPDRTIGVLTVEMLAGGGLRAKAYLGGHGADALADGAPAEVRALAARMARVCPLPGYHYVTVRLGGERVRYAVNKIYNHVQLGFTERGGLDAAWAEVGALFAAAGREEAFAGLRAALADLEGVRVVPTATALEADGADVYCGAWWMGG